MLSAFMSMVAIGRLEARRPPPSWSLALLPPLRRTYDGDFPGVPPGAPAVLLASARSAAHCVSDEREITRAHARPARLPSAWSPNVRAGLRRCGPDSRCNPLDEIVDHEKLEDADLRRRVGLYACSCEP